MSSWIPWSSYLLQRCDGVCTPTPNPTPGIEAPTHQPLLPKFDAIGGRLALWSGFWPSRRRMKPRARANPEQGVHLSSCPGICALTHAAVMPPHAKSAAGKLPPTKQMRVCETRGAPATSWVMFMPTRWPMTRSIWSIRLQRERSAAATRYPPARCTSPS